MKLLQFMAVAAALLTLVAGPVSAGVCSQNACSTRLMGVVTSGAALDGQPVQNAAVSIYQAGIGAPVLLAATLTNARGHFSVVLPKQGVSEIRYAVAAKGRTELMTVMAAADRPHVRINEMTTVASAYAMAQFFNGKTIAGKPLPLQVATGMFRNLAAPDRGEVSKVLRRSPNADQTNAQRLMATLSNVLANCVRNVAIDNCAPLFTWTGGTTTLEAAISIAHNPANKVHEIFALGYALQPFQPALTASLGPDAPDEMMRLDAFTVAVKVNRSGGVNKRGKELCPWGGPGNLVFDDNGYAWITNNLLQGTTINANCFGVLKPDGSPADGRHGTPNSPIFGGGVLGQGFGITRDPSGHIWAGNFGWFGTTPNGSVSKFSSIGVPLSPKAGYASTLDQVQGTVSDQDGNIWMASYGNSQVNVFPGGDPFSSYPAYIDENTDPFDIEVNNDGAAYVSYTGTSNLSKLTLSPTGLVKQFTVSLGTASDPKGIALDTAGNVWATASAESEIYAYSPDGSLLGIYSGGGLTGPWGLSVDSHDNVWVANFGPANQLGLKYRLSQLCAVTTSHCPDGYTVGQAISPETGYTLPSGGDQVRLANGQPLYGRGHPPSYQPLMRATATMIDMAGNVWVTNNFKPSTVYDAVNPGGDGMVIFVGMAAPVKPGTGGNSSLGQPAAP